MTSDAYSQMIDHLAKIKRVPDHEINRIRILFKEETIEKGQCFLSAGEKQTRIGFNLTGVFRYYYLDIKGRERTKHFSVENDWVLSLSAFLDRKPALFFIESLGKSRILSIPVDRVSALIQQSSYWQEIYRGMLETYYLRKEKREAQFLLNGAKKRYLDFVKEYPDLLDRISQQHIAAYLAVTPVTLSRIRSDLKSN